MTSIDPSTSPPVKAQDDYDDSAFPEKNCLWPQTQINTGSNEDSTVLKSADMYLQSVKRTQDFVRPASIKKNGRKGGSSNVARKQNTGPALATQRAKGGIFLTLCGGSWASVGSDIDGCVASRIQLIENMAHQRALARSTSISVQKGPTWTTAVFLGTTRLVGARVASIVLLLYAM